MKNYVATLLMLLLTAPCLAQKTAPDAVETLQGIGIGTSLEEARSVLARIGTGGGRDTRDGGRKEAWTLKETDFASLAFKTNGKGRVVWISAFIRAGKEMPFAKFGDLTKATTLTKSQAIWNISNARGGYRLVAKGVDGKASVVYLLSLDFPEIQ
jgi:hypothetical protein